MSTRKNQFVFRAVAVTLVIFVLLFGGVSITRVAAQSALPGDAFYPVKTTIEQARLSLAQNAGDRAQMKMSFAEQRLQEMDALIKEGRYGEVDQVVLAFESNINSAILELQLVAKADPARASQLALEITSALTRYSQTLTNLVVNVPDNVKPEINRALDSANVAGGLEMTDDENDDNSNSNVNANSNINGGVNLNINGNENSSDDSSINGNDNSSDDSSNVNSNDDSSDDFSFNGNDNSSDDSGSDDSGGNSNDDSGSDDSGGDSSDD